jgi:hypothetical protein
MRRAIYERARATIARQLTSVDPPLPAESIEAQHQLLEQAIVETEAEYALEEIDPAEFEAEIGLHAPQDEDVAEEPDEEPGHAEALIDYGTPGVDYAPPQQTVDIRPSRAPMMIVLGLLLLAGIGAAVVGFRYQEQIMAFVDDLSGADETMTADAEADGDAMSGDMAAETAPADAEGSLPEENGIAKSEERLGEVVRADNVDELRGSEPGVTILPRTSNAATEMPLSEPEGTQPLASVPEGTADVATEDQADAVGAMPDGDTAAMEPVVTGAAGPADVDVGTDTVGNNSLKAIYYTQGAEDTPGAASEGQVTWSRIDQPNGLPAIQGRIGVADPKIDVVITISKNTDPGLPASHLIEITFEGTENMSNAALERIPALVLKPNEQARGQPLVGAGVPVTDSIFWIALSDKADQVTSNVATLREGSWFDMPLLFKDQKRALITFEKGGAGDALFKEVLDAWEAS